jgi:SAM-dependent methyltransferase
MDTPKMEANPEGYMAYVGPAAQYDFMGATQFRLLTTLGLRASHDVLDIGCGSLRTGRFLICYLDKGHYYGIEPNEWLIEDAVNEQIGNDLIRIKEPHFDHNADFRTDVFSRQFDFIIAQSIFSHTGSDLIETALSNIRDSLDISGIAAVTFVEGIKDFQGAGWVYPEAVRYRRTTIRKMLRDSGLYARRIPWYHPRQTWYILAKSNKRLPPYRLFHYLRGAVLDGEDFYQSWKWSQKFLASLRSYLSQVLPPRVKEHLKRLTKEPDRE